jgi:hypothetical protein
MEEMIPIFGIVFTFGIPGLIIFWIIYTKHKERMRLIEKGITPEDAKKYFAEEQKAKNPFGMLKFALVLLFLGAGIIIANILSEYYYVNDGITIGLVILFVGIGYLTYYFIAMQKMKNNSITTTAKENS